MKSIIKILLFVILSVCCVEVANAQKGGQRISREQLAEVQAKYIAEEVGMDDTTSVRFIDVYCQFQREIWALGPRPRQMRRSMDEAEAERATKERFAHSQKILDIRQKYYGIYSKFLTQKQIQRVYELEAQMMERLRNKARIRHRR